MLTIDYSSEYVKYKNKYLQQKNQNGGNKNGFNIIEFIKKQSLSTIEKDLLKLMDNQKYCDKILGKGLLGEVFVPGIDSNVTITIKKTQINIPIVIKKSNQHDNSEIGIKMINNKLCIYAYLNITLEAIILSYINELWYKKLSPHLPFMVGYSCCNNKDKISVDKIITEKHGLKDNVVIELEGYNENPIWHPPRDNKNPMVFDSNIATLSDLMKYTIIKMKNGKVVLPNNIKCDVIKLMDYLTISYIHTHNLLQTHNIVISDMHPHNIFIHWLNKNSYLGDTCINNTKYINYQFNDKIIKIKTYGLLLKIGDVGTSIVMPRNDILILGQAYDLEKNIHLVDQMIKPNYNVRQFLDIFKWDLPGSLYVKTIAHKILSAYPYNEIVNFLPLNHNLLKDYLTPYEMLEKFDKYFVNKYDKDNDTLIVKG